MRNQPRLRRVSWFWGLTDLVPAARPASSRLVFLGSIANARESNAGRAPRCNGRSGALSAQGVRVQSTQCGPNSNVSALAAAPPVVQVLRLRHKSVCAPCAQGQAEAASPQRAVHMSAARDCSRLLAIKASEWSAQRAGVVDRQHGGDRGGRSLVEHNPRAEVVGVRTDLGALPRAPSNWRGAQTPPRSESARSLPRQ